jgi:hypothetical protein
MDPKPYPLARWKIDGLDIVDDGRESLDVTLHIPLTSTAKLEESFGDLTSKGVEVWIALYAMPAQPEAKD